MKRLYLLRHANAENETPLDEERELSKKGVNQAQLIGQYIADNNLGPNKILCSSAIRTRQTADNVARYFIQDCNKEHLDELYLALPGEILKKITSQTEKTNSIMVVGHNPGIQQLAIFLLGENRAGGQATNLISNFTPATLACYSLDIENWSDIAANSGILDAVVSPKLL